MTGLGSLIWTNVRRNLARSLLTVIGMGLAALVMTASLTLSQGYPAAAFVAYRDYVGGDVLVFPDKVWVRGADVNASVAGTWRPRLASADLPGPWSFFQPDLATRGSIGPSGSRGVLVTAAELEELATALAAQAGAGKVRPYFTLPAGRAEFAAGPASLVGLPGTPSAPRAVLAWTDAYLRGWRAGEWTGLDAYVVSGRPLAAADAGALVCLVDADRARLGTLPDSVLPTAVPPVGGQVRVQLPRLRSSASGEVQLDYQDPVWVDLTVVGQYSVPSRVASWTPAGSGSEAGAAPPETEQLYLTSPEIIVPWETAAALLGRMSAGQLDVWVTAVAFEVENLAHVESVVSAVNAAWPEYAAVSVPKLAAAANARWLPEPVYRVPAEEWQGAAVSGQQGEPVQISRAFNAIFFAVAALLAAANSIILVLERQREIGILKAVGAYARDVMLMIMGEIVLLSSIGAICGFILAETMAIWNLISNHTAWLEIVSAVGFDLVRVLGLTVAFAALFGLFPALRTTRMTAMEVLRRE